MQVAKVGDGFRIDTADETLQAKHVIWTAGEFQYPRLSGFCWEPIVSPHRDHPQL